MTTSASLHEALVEHATIDHRFRDLFAALLAKDASAAAIAERLFATVRAHFAAEEAHIARFAAVDAAEAAALRAEHHELDAMMRGLEEALAGAGLSTHDVVEFKARFSLHEAREETGFYRRMRVAG